jgi:hypothetical protein
MQSFHVKIAGFGTVVIVAHISPSAWFAKRAIASIACPKAGATTVSCVVVRQLCGVAKMYNKRTTLSSKTLWSALLSFQRIMA